MSEHMPIPLPKGLVMLLRSALQIGYAPQAAIIETNTPVVNLYDFDGVIAYPFEEALFRMPETDHDNEFVRVVCERLDLDLGSESLRSARYVCIQATLHEHGLGLVPGPMFSKVEEPFHIITARSDRFAVARLHDFIKEYGLRPNKILQTDCLPKGQVIEMLLERHPDTHFRFWDDTMKHILSARLLRSARLEVFHVDNDMEPLYEKAQSYYRNTILELVL